MQWLQVKVTTDGESETPVLRVVKPRSFYSNEARWLGLCGVVMGEGVCGEVWEGWEGEELVSWPLPPSVTGWDILAFEIVRLLQTSPLGNHGTNTCLYKPVSSFFSPFATDSSTDVLVARVTGTIRLVTQMMKSDWSLSTELHRITSQTFSMLQRYLHTLSLHHRLLLLHLVDLQLFRVLRALCLPPVSPVSLSWLPTIQLR